MTEKHIPGLMVSIVKDGSLLLTKLALLALLLTWMLVYWNLLL
jgi:hypothetical protein